MRHFKSNLRVEIGPPSGNNFKTWCLIFKVDHSPLLKRTMSSMFSFMLWNFLPFTMIKRTSASLQIMYSFEGWLIHQTLMTWMTFFTWPCLCREVGLDNLQRFFPTLTILWVCAVLFSNCGVGWYLFWAETSKWRLIKLNLNSIRYYAPDKAARDLRRFVCRLTVR